MAEHTIKKEAMVQNLKDAGCDRELIEYSIRLFSEGKIKEVLAVLAKHRGNLLNNCHIENKKIDCLDYLIFQIKKRKD